MAFNGLATHRASAHQDPLVMSGQTPPSLNVEWRFPDDVLYDRWMDPPALLFFHVVVSAIGMIVALDRYESEPNKFYALRHFVLWWCATVVSYMAGPESLFYFHLPTVLYRMRDWNGVGRFFGVFDA
jgi:hypothetical protein